MKNYIDNFTLIETPEGNDYFECNMVEGENKIVTFQEVFNKVTDDTLQVCVTDWTDTQETKQVDFYDWLNSEVKTVGFIHILQGILNERRA